MSDCLLSKAIGHIEDSTKAADDLSGAIGGIYTELIRLSARGVRLPRRLLRLIESAEGIANSDSVTNALDRADAFVSAMQLHGVRS